MKKIFIAIVSVLVFSCTGYGDKIENNGTEIYYKEGVSKETAEKVGNYLNESGFSDGTAKSVQITKDSVYNFRMVVQKQFEQDSTKDFSFLALGYLLSKDVFNGEDINFQLCDNTFNTVRTIPVTGTGKE